MTEMIQATINNLPVEVAPGATILDAARQVSVHIPTLCKHPDLEATIKKADVDLVIIGTPIDLTRVLKINKPFQRVRYELQEIGQPTLEDILKTKFGK